MPFKDRERKKLYDRRRVARIRAVTRERRAAEADRWYRGEIAKTDEQLRAELSAWGITPKQHRAWCRLALTLARRRSHDGPPDRRQRPASERRPGAGQPYRRAARSAPAAGI